MQVSLFKPRPLRNFPTAFAPKKQNPCINIPATNKHSDLNNAFCGEQHTIRYEYRLSVARAP